MSIKREDIVEVLDGHHAGVMGICVNIVKAQRKDSFDMYFVEFKDGYKLAYPQHMLKKVEGA